MAFCVLATASGYAYLRYQFGRIPTLSGLSNVLRGDDPDADPGGPMTVLLVGSDTRATIDPKERASFGSTRQVGGQRSDTIILLRVDPRAETAAMLSVPRDLFVPIAGTKGSARINTAFEQGPEPLIATITQVFGVPIDHYVQVDFNGFRAIVSAVGGVPIYSPSRARDKVTGLNVNAGCVTLDGNQALAFVRSRNYEFFENGRWRTDPTADLGRIQRQQEFVRRVVKKGNQKARGMDFLAINRLINAGVKNVKRDSALDLRDVSRLAYRFKSLEPSAVQMLTIPTVAARVGEAAVLRMKQPDTKAVIDQFLDRTPKPPAGARAQAVPAIPRASIRVRVLNGSGAEGQARQVGQELSAAGFTVAGLGQAGSYRFTDSVISYSPGQRDKALVMQAAIAGPSQLKEVPGQSVEVVLTTGGLFGGVVGAPSAASTTPPKAGTTTTPKAKTTKSTTTTAPTVPTC